MASNTVGLGEPLADPADAVVDILFVHGLGGDRVRTWSDDGVFWPKDALPADIPKARILSFGYRAKIIEFWGPPSDNRLDNHADDLFAELSGFRVQTGTTERPIILVAHSLGGLVCQQAILSAENRSEEQTRNTALRVRRIAFFGTPHEGSEKANWGEAARRFMDLMMDTNKTLLKDLKEGSDKLAQLDREFPNLLRRRAKKTEEEIEVMCFFEGKEFKLGGKKIGKVVPEASAVLSGYPNLSLYADHKSMCRFDGRDDENYQKVVKVLQSWVKALQQPREAKDGATYNAESHFTGTFYGGMQHGQVIGGDYTIGATTYNVGVPAQDDGRSK